MNGYPEIISNQNYNKQNEIKFQQIIKCISDTSISEKNGIVEESSDQSMIDKCVVENFNHKFMNELGIDCGDNDNENVGNTTQQDLQDKQAYCIYLISENHSNEIFNSLKDDDEKVIIEDVIEQHMDDIDVKDEGEAKSPSKRLIVRDANFNPTTRVNDMKTLLEKRFSFEFKPERLLDLTPSVEFKRATTADKFPKTRKTSVRIMYLAKYLEEKLYNKKEDQNDKLKDREDNILQIILDKPLIKSNKKVSRSSRKISFD